MHTEYNFSKERGESRVAELATELFQQTTNRHEASKEIADMLYNATLHPNIKSGELYVVYFEGITFDGEETEVIGLFKTETKTSFFEIQHHAEKVAIEHKRGIDPKKLDKGCLIINQSNEFGYKVLCIDNQSKGDGAKFWTDEFLGLARMNNEFEQTNQILGMTKQFIKTELQEAFEIDKKDEIGLLNRSVEYFQKNDQYDKQEFQEHVFQQPEVVEQFDTFNEDFKMQHNVDFEDSFEISEPAVKKQAKEFKSVLKLDKNFHIYIHGDEHLIEKGVDEESGKKYYKIFYDSEQ